MEPIPNREAGELDPTQAGEGQELNRRRSNSSVILLSLVVYGLLFMALLTRNGSILALTLPFIFFLAAAYLYAPKSPRLKINRQLSDETVSAGRPVTMTVTVTNLGEDLDEILVIDQPPKDLKIIEGATANFARLPQGESLVVQYTLQGDRGSYPIDRTYINVNDHLSLVSWRITLRQRARFSIKPAVWRLRSIPIRPLNTHLYTGPIPARRGGDGMNFFEVRSYQIGDPLRQINWKATASAQFRSDGGELFTNKFEVERVSDVGIILDARLQTNVTIPNAGERVVDDPNAHTPMFSSLFEYNVTAAAAMADLFLRDGHRVGLLIYGRGQQATFPGYGKSQRERILRALAQARTGENMALENLSYLPVRFFPPRSQIVLVSSLSPADPPILTRLLAHGYKLLVISPDPVTYEASAYNPGFDTPRNMRRNQRRNQRRTQRLARRFARIERVLLLRRLQSYGITIIDWDVSIPLEQVLGKVMLRAPREYRRLGIGL